MRRSKRNTAAFTFLAWASFILALSFLIVGIWNTDWPLVEKGYYAGCFLWGISSAFVLAKVVRDNEEDKEYSE
jgi:uncharacterized membrane protein YiaA